MNPTTPTNEIKTTNSIYVVFGTTGEYSDRIEWVVKAFHTEEQAIEFVTNVTERKDKAEAPYNVNHYVPYNAIEKVAKEIGDPNYHSDYTGTRYYYESVPLEE